MNYLISLFLIISSALSGTLPLLPLQEIASEKAGFNEQEITLTGTVKIVHEMGILRCHNAILLLPQNSSEQDRLFADTIHLSKNVQIAFTDGSHIIADRAEIDCHSLQATFYGTPFEQVIYTTTAGSSHVPVQVKGHKLVARIVKKLEGYTLHALHGEGAVNIEYTSHPFSKQVRNHTP